MNSTPPEPRDLFIIGGGINGCGIARDAAGRGYTVTLAEMNDLASGTSSWSTKLIHGGLRYLEFYEFRLVREALQEREVLWAMAPHIIWPLRFVLPHHAGLRPRWLLRLGLFLYDHLGGRKRLPPARTLDLERDAAGAALKESFTRGFEYSDCWVDDARLVVLNAMDAAARGADIRVRTRVVRARRENGLWQVELEDLASGERETVNARMLVNAAGPWVDGVLGEVLGRNGAHNVRLVQGSHIVVRRLVDHDRCYIFQNADGRVVFAIPYERYFTLIGTTDQDHEGDPADARISEAEIDYLRAAASDYFSRPITSDDVVWTYSGVRPLFDDGASKAQEATRDYVLSVEGDGEGALINIFGGKLTTYRRLAEAVMSHVSALAGRPDERWTAGSVLPGGDFPADAFQATADGLKADYPFLGDSHAWRLCRLYGTRARLLLGAARSLDDLGTCFGSDLYEAEVRYLVEDEWARSADDILWRRTKLGLLLTETEQAALADWLDGRRGAAERSEQRG